MQSSSIEIVQLIDSPAHKIWEILTQRAHLKNWYFEFGEDWQLEVGATFEWTAQDLEGKNWLHRGQFITIEPNKILSHTWEYPGYNGKSLLTWALSSDVNESTKLTLIHSFDPPFDPEVKALDRSNFVNGWNAIVGKNLPNYLKSIADH